MEDKNIKYEDALKQLETLVSKMESGEVDIDELTSCLKKAKELIVLCKDKLMKTEKEIEELKN